MATLLKVNSKAGQSIEISYAAGSIVMTVVVHSQDAGDTAFIASVMSARSASEIGSALGETVTAVSMPVTVGATSSAAVIGIAVGCGVLGLALILIGGICLYKKKKKNAKAPVTFTNVTVDNHSRTKTPTEFLVADSVFEEAGGTSSRAIPLTKLSKYLTKRGDVPLTTVQDLLNSLDANGVSALARHCCC